MAERTSIGWTERTWNPVRGCSRTSTGCERCYAERVAGRFSGKGQPYEGLVRRGVVGGSVVPRWNGEVRVSDSTIFDPLRWRKPAVIFVNSMADLFHENLGEGLIDEVLAVMLLSPRHTFQVLTKRAKRMREYLSDPTLYARVLKIADRLRVTFPCPGVGISNPSTFPAPWIWWGVSVENQRYADERISELLATPAAVRFVSYEPALGPVRFPWRWCVRCGVEPERNAETHLHCHDDGLVRKLDLVIVGAESGPGCRPFEVAWARSTVEQCRAAGVSVYVKQDSGPRSGMQGRIPDDLWAVKELPGMAGDGEARGGLERGTR